MSSTPQMMETRDNEMDSRFFASRKIGRIRRHRCCRRRLGPKKLRCFIGGIITRGAKVERLMGIKSGCLLLGKTCILSQEACFPANWSKQSHSPVNIFGHSLLSRQLSSPSPSGASGISALPSTLREERERDVPKRFSF